MQLDLATSKDIAEVMAEIRAIRQRLDDLAPPPEWVSVVEYMDRKGVPKSTVYRWLSEGRIQDNGKTGKLRAIKIDSYSEPRDPKESYKPSKKLAARVFKRDGEICAYCKTTDGPFQLDHIVPWSRGGKTQATNLTVCCPSCNLQKGTKLLSEWKRPRR